MEKREQSCVIAGGGPAGMMAGYLLAQSGVSVRVLEKHKDFLRDFRGDTIHASTLDVMWELGLLDRFLKLPHQKVTETFAEFGSKRYRVIDFGALPTHCKFIVLMPQWDFLNFLAEEAKRFPHFQLEMQAEATDLISDNGRVSGVRYQTPHGQKEARADLVIAADGRGSRLRDAADFELVDLGSPIDCMWFKLPWHPGDPTSPQGRTSGGEQLAMLYRKDYWQCALIIAKGRDGEIRNEGLPAFHDRLRRVAGFAADRVETIKSFDEVSLLSVSVNHVKRWARPGLLCIGDAAHAMSPVFGCGINLALQDAIATANILGPILARNSLPTLRQLQKVQRRREYPTRVYQRAQVRAHKRQFSPAAKQRAQNEAPLIVKLRDRWLWLRQWRANFGAVGVRPEHVRIPAIARR